MWHAAPVRGKPAFGCVAAALLQTPSGARKQKRGAALPDSVTARLGSAPVRAYAGWTIKPLASNGEEIVWRTWKENTVEVIDICL